MLSVLYPDICRVEGGCIMKGIDGGRLECI
jgi:hypothetical protein